VGRDPGQARTDAARPPARLRANAKSPGIIAPRDDIDRSFDKERNRATNFYVWNSEDAARGFFTDQLRERVTGLYGVAPTVDFVEIAQLVENG